MSALVTPTGWEVDAIVLDGRSLYRIQREGFWVADVPALEDVQQVIGAEFLHLRDKREKREKGSP